MLPPPCLLLVWLILVVIAMVVMRLSELAASCHDSTMASTCQVNLTADDEVVDGCRLFDDRVHIELPDIDDRRQVPGNTDECQ